MGNANMGEPISDQERSEETYKLKWNEFNVNILNSLRLLQDEKDFIDVTISCDGYSFVAHQVILSACSPYFHSLLEENPCEHPVIVIPDIQKQDMETLLKFIYYGEVHISEEQLSEFLKTAETLQIYGLTNVSSKQDIIDNLKDGIVSNETIGNILNNKKQHRVNNVAKNSKSSSTVNLATSEAPVPKIEEAFSQTCLWSEFDDYLYYDESSTNLENTETNVVDLANSEDSREYDSILKIKNNNDDEFISIGGEAIASIKTQNLENFSSSSKFHTIVKQQDSELSTKINQMKTKVWNRRDYCVFCFRFVTHFSRHLYRHHPQEESVKKIMVLDKRSAVRKKMIEMLRLKGHSKGRNDLVVPKHIGGSEKRNDVNETFFCLYCKKSISKNVLSRHTEFCKLNPKNNS